MNQDEPVDKDETISGVFALLDAADIIYLSQEQVDELIAKYRKELELKE